MYTEVADFESARSDARYFFHGGFIEVDFSLPDRRAFALLGKLSIAVRIEEIALHVGSDALRMWRIRRPEAKVQKPGTRKNRGMSTFTMPVERTKEVWSAEPFPRQV